MHELRQSLDDDLRVAYEFHGHLCHGMVLGVRLARYACRLLGIASPREYRDLVVYVELDRCASDAISAVTGATLGRRRLKWVDYGKMAGTFVDLRTGKALRVAPRPEVPHARREDDPLSFWNDWTDEQLFTVMPVKVNIPPEDLPGRPIRSVVCAGCGEIVQDARDVTVEGMPLCKACARGAYYEPLEDVEV